MAERGAEDAVNQDGNADSEDALSRLERTQRTYMNCSSSCLLGYICYLESFTASFCNFSRAKMGTELI
jgi:hypothetical protein